MSIRVTKSTMVRPANDTPSETLRLSQLDMLVLPPSEHTHVSYVYHHPGYYKIDTDDIHCSSTSYKFFDADVLIESLGRVLVPFYPMAGRLLLNEKTNRHEIVCNAKGVLFIEAEATNHVLADFGEHPIARPDSEFPELVIPACDYSKGISSIPLLVVQHTRFKCGGVCLGFLYHQHIGDGFSHLHFTTSWARLTKGVELSVYPIFDRATCLGLRRPPRITFQHSDQYEPPPPLVPNVISDNMVTAAKEGFFQLTKKQIEGLKLQATYNRKGRQQNETSTFAVLAGHVWRTACMARGLAGDQDVRLYIVVNGRLRLKDPPLPKGFFGNVVLYSTCIEKAGDVMCKPFWHVARKINEAVKKMDDDEYLRSAMGYVESHPDIKSITRGSKFFSYPNLAINSWGRMPFREADFGWGEPKFIGTSSLKYEGQTFLIPSMNGDGSYFVYIKLLAPHMAFFKKFFYNNLNNLSSI